MNPEVSQVILILDGQQGKDIPDYGDLFTLEVFVEYCKDGILIDYDGSGYYAIERKMYAEYPARPSDISKDKIDERFSHVAWFNR